ncbi:hypothetical protein IQ225_15365 [Synechocystis salina LEGE 06155]|nr:hypothetical protein [Synechocystis salina LEGE 06155]
MAVSNTISQDEAPAVLICFSGGQEIFRKNVVEGPFADEYKFAHEIKIADSEGEHWVNFSGGMCVIDQGEFYNKKQLKLTDNLSCYSGAKKIVTFDVYGEETTIDEYVEGRTFLAKANGNALSSNSIHQYLLFGNGTCIGEEIGKN